MVLIVVLVACLEAQADLGGIARGSRMVGGGQEILGLNSSRREE